MEYFAPLIFKINELGITDSEIMLFPYNKLPHGLSNTNYPSDPSGELSKIPHIKYIREGR